MKQEKQLMKAAFAAPLVIAAMMSASTAVAEDKATLLSNQASYCEIFQAINPEVPEECLDELSEAASAGGLTRGIKINQAKQAVDTAIQGNAGASNTWTDTAATEPAGPQTIAMNIQFAFDSSQLTLDAMATLDRVAEVLNSDLMREKSIIVEGHTDTIGSDSYNLTLSTQRALAVQFYLVEQHLIDVNRLQITGKGEMELFDSADPKGAVNRRVEFTNLNS
ncbi:MAG: OmpA family protein [Geminicoccaceae bacterium]